MGRKKIAWRDQAKVQLRAVDQPTALRLLRALGHFAATGEGDVKRLQDIEPPEFGCASATTASASTTGATRSTSPPSSIAAKLTAERRSMSVPEPRAFTFRTSLRRRRC